MKIHQLSLDEAFHSLHSDPKGLSPAEARRRLEEFGPNRVERVAGISMLRRFLQGFTHFFAIVLMMAAGLAFFAEWQEPGTGMATLGVAILAVILINGLFSFWQEYRAERSMAALLKLLPHQAKVIRSGTVHTVPTEELVPGDLLVIADGDEVPADCRVVEAFGVSVNLATVTGESFPQVRDALPCSEEDLLRGRNILLAGTSMVSGQAQALIFATGMRTEFGKIAHLTQDTRAALSPLQREIVRLSRLVACLAAGLGVLFFSLGVLIGMPFWANFLFAIGIIVANVPEGLLPTVTLALAMGSQRMAKKNALIRNLPSVETLGSATVICTDKTGTLTQNRMEVRRLYFSGNASDVGDAGRLKTFADSHRPFFEAAYHCHNLRETENGGSRMLMGDPMELALVELAKRALPDAEDCPRIDQIPFDSERRRQSTVHRTAHGDMLFTKGAGESVIPLCDRVLHEGTVRPLGAELRQEFARAQDTFGRAGLRVLGVAYRPLDPGWQREGLEVGLILAGLVGLEDPPRPEVPVAVARCREAGIKVVMVTGDHPQTAVAIARGVGLVSGDAPTVITGDRLRRMSLTQLQLALDRPEVLFARVLADQKMLIVKALRAKGHVVAVTGDGVNDAPALRQADIGIAMGVVGTDVAREAADMVLLDDNFATIVAAIEEGRAAFANIRKFLTYILTSNVPEIIPYLAFVLFRIPLALTVLQILAVDLGTDMLPALSLGVEKPEPGVMREPPRRRNQRLIDLPLLLRSYLFLGVIEAAAAMAVFLFVLAAGGWSYGQELAAQDLLYQRATTACLATIVVMQIVNLFVCRSETRTTFSSRRSPNRWILPAIAIEVLLILLIAYTPQGNEIFGTAPLPASVWLLPLPFALGMLLSEEIRKWLIRRAMKSQQAAAGPNSTDRSS